MLSEFLCNQMSLFLVFNDKAVVVKLVCIAPLKTKSVVIRMKGCQFECLLFLNIVKVI